MSFLLERFRLGARGPWSSRAALVTEQGTIAYAELDEAVTETAAELRRCGFRRGDAAVSALATGAPVAVSMFGVWSLGGVYVPVSAVLPTERERALIEGISPRVVIRSARSADGSERLRFEEPASGAVRPVAGDSRADVAYVVYTSGSTGRPKGVVVSHDNLVTLAENHEACIYARFAPHASKVSFNNPPETDASLSELVQLAYGRTLHPIEPGLRSHPAALASFLDRHGLDVLDATPSQVRSLLLAGHRRVLEQLSLLMVGGEAVDPDLWDDLADLPVPVVNMYGPSECTVDVTFAEVTRDTSPTIGRELPGTTIRIVGPDGDVLPDGAVGEIQVSGAQVALGYLDSAAAGTGGFGVEGGDTGPHTYCTGDRGERLASGALRFVGRVDDQVKVRGHRIELGDVEHALRAHAGVRWAGVVADQDGLATVLRAFLVLEPGTELSDVAEHLGRQLPAPARPTLHRVDEVPLAGSGKVDRSQLLTLVQPVGDAQEPRGAEDVVREAWSRHVGVEVSGDQDDFFAAGGNSIGAAMLTVELRERCCPGLSIDVLYAHPILRDYIREVTALMPSPLTLARAGSAEEG